MMLFIFGIVACLSLHLHYSIPLAPHNNWMSIRQPLDDHINQHSQTDSLYAGATMRFSSLRSLFQPNSRVKEQCAKYGCQRGITKAGTSPRSCYMTTICVGCVPKSKVVTPEQFCSQFDPLPNLNLMVGELVAEPIEDTEESPQEMPGFGDLLGALRGKEGESESKKGKKMDMDDDEDGENVMAQMAKMAKMGMGNFGGFLEESSLETKGNSDEDPQSFLLEEAKMLILRPPMFSDTIGENDRVMLKFSYLSSTVDNFSKCDQSMHGGDITLRFDIFITQTALQKYSKEPKIMLEISFTGTGKATEECSDPAYFYGPIPPTKLFHVSLNIPVSIDLFREWLREGNFSEQIVKKLRITLTCKSYRCRSNIYFTCAKISCAASPAWKQNQPQETAKRTALLTQYNEKAKILAEKLKEAKERLAMGKLEEEKQIREEQEKAEAEKNRQNTAIAVMKEKLMETPKERHSNPPGIVSDKEKQLAESMKKSMKQEEEIFAPISILAPPTSKQRIEALNVKYAAAA